MQTFEVAAGPGPSHRTGEPHSQAPEGDALIYTLSLPSSLFPGLYFLHLPLPPRQTHCFTVPSSECFESCRQNISLFNKEISIFMQGHIQVPACGVTIVSSLGIYRL